MEGDPCFAPKKLYLDKVSRIGDWWEEGGMGRQWGAWGDNGGTRGDGGKET